MLRKWSTHHFPPLFLYKEIRLFRNSVNQISVWGCSFLAFISWEAVSSAQENTMEVANWYECAQCILKINTCSFFKFLQWANPSPAFTSCEWGSGIALSTHSPAIIMLVFGKFRAKGFGYPLLFLPETRIWTRNFLVLPRSLPVRRVQSKRLKAIRS